MKKIYSAEALAITSTDLPYCRFADPDGSWRSDSWACLREMHETGETALSVCGSELVFGSLGCEECEVLP